MILKNQHQNKIEREKIIWFNPPFSKNVSTNIGKKIPKFNQQAFPTTKIKIT